MDELRDRVHAILGEAILAATGMDLELTDELSLIDSGLLDSLSIVSVVQALQDAFDIEIDFADVSLENFDSLGVIVPFVASRKGT